MSCFKRFLPHRNSSSAGEGQAAVVSTKPRQPAVQLGRWHLEIRWPLTGWHTFIGYIPNPSTTTSESNDHDLLEELKSAGLAFDTMTIDFPTVDGSPAFKKVKRDNSQRGKLQCQICFEYVEPQEILTPCRQCCLLYTSPSPRDGLLSRMPSSA